MRPITRLFPHLQKAAPSRWWFGMWFLVLLTGCTTRHYRKSADRETYGVIQNKSPGVPNSDGKFTIEQTNTLVFDDLPLAGEPADFLGADGEAERGARLVNLEDSL